MNIKMPRGDIRNIKFNITNKEGTTITTDFDEIYITFKRGFYDNEALFQKKLTDETIIKDENNYYHFTIESEDTDNLDYGDYVFDIELVINDLVKQTIVGNLTLTNEVTFASNEV